MILECHERVLNEALKSMGSLAETGWNAAFMYFIENKAKIVHVSLKTVNNYMKEQNALVQSKSH